MKKIKYKTVDVKQLDWIKLAQRFEKQKVVFSTDAAKHDFVAVLSDERKEHQVLMKWKHPIDTGYLLKQLETHFEPSQLEAVMEPTGTYSDALRWQLNQRGFKVYRVSGKQTHDQKESFDGVPSSHDAKAALIIVELHLNGKSRLWQEQSERQKDLRSLVNELEIYQRTHRSNVNRLSALMSRHWPELDSLMELDSVSVLSLLSEYGSPSACVQEAEAAVQVMSRAGRAGLKEEKLEAVLDSAQNTLGVPCSAGEQMYIQQLAKDLLRTLRASQAVEKRIAQALEVHEVSGQLTACCGKVTSGVLLAFLGDLRDYAHTSGLLKAAGLNLKEESSGQHKSQLRITKRGSGRVRFYLYWLAMRLVSKDAHIRRWYERKVMRDGGRNKGRALVAVMRKTLKGLWHAARGQSFDSQKLFNLSPQNPDKRYLA